MPIKLIDPASLPLDKPVRVYRNLHNDLMSVQHLTLTGWRVLGHTADIILADAKFVVIQSGRQRVLATGRKNVHAFIQGYPCNPVVRPLVMALMPAPVYYNPYKSAHFGCADGHRVDRAEYCIIENCKPAIAYL